MPRVHAGLARGAVPGVGLCGARAVRPRKAPGGTPDRLQHLAVLRRGGATVATVAKMASNKKRIAELRARFEKSDTLQEKAKV